MMAYVLNALNTIQTRLLKGDSMINYLPVVEAMMSVGELINKEDFNAVYVLQKNKSHYLVTTKKEDISLALIREDMTEKFGEKKNHFEAYVYKKNLNGTTPPYEIKLLTILGESLSNSTPPVFEQSLAMHTG